MKNNGRYILIGQTPVPCDDLKQWALSMESNDRRVGLTQIGPVQVSTVFLGLDHNFHSLIYGGNGTPILFETMAFAGDDSMDECERCSTWTEAELQHRAMVEQFHTKFPDDPVVNLLATQDAKPV